MAIFLALLNLSTLTGPRFEDITSAAGLNLANEAACWIDFDRDGWTDLVSGGVAWRSLGGERFVKQAEGLGSVVAADMDNDGYPDLFSWSTYKLFRSEKGRRFVEMPLPKIDPVTSRGACWGDLNNDGYVDIYYGGFEGGGRSITYPSFVLMNKKGKGFEITSQKAEFKTRGVTACDFNRDGCLDIYASNYRLQPNQLWAGQRDGSLKDVAAEMNALATSPGFAGGHSIGACWGDFDGDGEIDLFAGNFAHIDTRGDQPKSRFLRNRGPSANYAFEDKGICGVYYQESYASPAAGDLDNDGALDLFFTTVYFPASFGKPNHPVLFQNRGDFKFEDSTQGSGLEKLPPTYQAAVADFRNEGRLGVASAGKLFVNKTEGGSWLAVRLEGDGKTVNRSAIGAQVRILVRGRRLTRQVEAGTGEGNQNDLKLHFGLGEAKGPLDLEITWPGGKRQFVRGLKLRQTVDIRQS